MKSLQQKAKQILKDHNIEVRGIYTDKTGSVNYRIKLIIPYRKKLNKKALKALEILTEIREVTKVGFIESTYYSLSSGYTIHTTKKPSLISSTLLEETKPLKTKEDARAIDVNIVKNNLSDVFKTLQLASSSISIKMLKDKYVNLKHFCLSCNILTRQEIREIQDNVIEEITLQKQREENMWT